MNLQKENMKRILTCNKLGTTDKVKKIQSLGFDLVNTTSAHICGAIELLENQFKDGTLVERVTIAGNNKTGEIPAISFPNIFGQATFMRLIKKNPWMREKYQSVSILMEYFENNKVCHNCGDCNGLCYNNHDLLMRPGKAISELRNLLAYIVAPNALIDKICRSTKFRTVFRINANGEIHSKEMMEFWFFIAKKMPRTIFYTYTKSYELFEEYLTNKKLPKNFILNMSIMQGREEQLKKFENLYSGNKFITVTSLPENSKNICIGDCTECDLCYRKLRKSNNSIYVLYHNSNLTLK